ncbi:gephyrin-like molybdotransferase Glp, partial [Singulisphaera rosea]
TRPSPLRFPLARAFHHSSDRPTYYPARRVEASNGFSLEPLDWAGSADLKAVALADGFAVFPAGDRDYVAGDVVEFVELG